MRCQQQISGIRWIDHISNATVSSHTGFMSVGEQIASRRIAIFSHIARLSDEVLAHQALRAHVDLSLGRLPGRDWKRCPGRPNNRWVDQIHHNTGNMPSTLWRSAILRGHDDGDVCLDHLPVNKIWITNNMHGYLDQTNDRSANTRNNDSLCHRITPCILWILTNEKPRRQFTPVIEQLTKFSLSLTKTEL